MYRDEIFAGTFLNVSIIFYDFWIFQHESFLLSRTVKICGLGVVVLCHSHTNVKAFSCEFCSKSYMSHSRGGKEGKELTFISIIERPATRRTLTTLYRRNRLLPVHYTRLPFIACGVRARLDNKIRV